MQDLKPYFFAFALAIAANVLTLKDGHNWGDDFSQYIINARNIVEGKPYASGIMLENPTIYPPGLPLVLAPLVKVFGVNFKVLKGLNILFWYFSIVFFYWTVSRAGERRLAALGSVFLAASSYFFFYKQNVLSDIPLFFFTCCALYLFERGLFVPFLLAASAAVWMRSAGNVLFAAALFYFLFIQFDLKKFAAVLAVAMLNALLMLPWIGVHPGFWSSIAQNPAEYLVAIWYNFATAFRSLWYFFCPVQTVFSSSLFDLGDRLLLWISPVIYLGFAWVFVRGWRRRELSYLECFSFLYLTLLIVWAGFTMPPGAFTRFVLPLVPFTFIAAWRFLKFLWRPNFDSGGWGRIIFLVLLLINISNIAINWNFNDDMIGRPDTRQMAAWLNQHTKPDEHFMFWKPRALALLSQRTGTAPWIWQGEQEHFYERVRTLGVSYIIVFKEDRDLMLYLDKIGKFNLVWENSGYKIFKTIL